MKVIYTLGISLLAALGFGQTSEFPAPYCEVDLAYIYAHPITLVQFAGIDQASTNDIWTSEHEDFTAVKGEVEQGKNYSIKVKGNTSGDFYTATRMFIDWNQNNEFEENEFYDLGWLRNTDGTEEDLINDETINYILTDIQVPSDAILGETRMRIINIFSYANSIPDSPMYSSPCGWDDIDNYGQAEDYTLLVKPSVNVVCEPSEPGENIGDTGCVNVNYQGQTVGYQTVRAADGNIWLQQNLGSTQVATNYDDQAAFGDLFQWGRFDDGHQLRNSQQSEEYPTPNNPTGFGLEGNPNFFVGGGEAYGGGYEGWWGNWTINDKWEAKSHEEATATNAFDPCKSIGDEWFIPTETDWENVIEAEGIGADEEVDNIVSAFESNLKLTVGGVRRDTEFAFVGVRGYYWSRTTSDTNDFIKYLYYSNFIVNPNAGDAKKQGSSVRCLKNPEVMAVSDLTKSNVSVYPNPTNGIVYINSKEKVKSLEVYNLNGQKMIESNSTNVNLTGFSRGIYLIKVTLENNSQKTLKIIKN